MSENTLTRNDKIRQIHRNYASFYPLFGGIVLVLIGITIGAVLFGDDSGYGTNLYTEAISVGLTILVLNGLQERRDKKNRIIELQEELVLQAGSRSNATAISAIDMLRKRGWLGRQAVNHGRESDELSLLEGVDLSFADLHNADLVKANLKSTNLRTANLKGGYLFQANLENTELLLTNLEGADLLEANLEGANLWKANLKGANLQGVKLNEYTILPDTSLGFGSNPKSIFNKYWTPDTDMTRYTDPNHLDFWQPEWAKADNDDV